MCHRDTASRLAGVVCWFDGPASTPVGHVAKANHGVGCK